jgi:Carbohydrate-selective porin, OprB family
MWFGAEARAYFVAGGLGILIGDGALNYRPEKILETYYSYSLNTWSALTFDYQFVDDPPTTPTGDRSIFLPAGTTPSFKP